MNRGVITISESGTVSMPTDTVWMTLQDYRNNGVIPYIQLGGKILYRESDIQKILMANYREAYRMKGV